MPSGFCPSKSLGSGCTSCGATGFTRRTVITTRSSVSWLWYWLERKSAPRIGMLPSPGTLSMVERTFSDMSPAMAKLCPSPSRTVVSAWREVSPGMKSPLA